MKKKFLSNVIIAGLALIALAGCSGSDENTPTTAQTTQVGTGTTSTPDVSDFEKKTREIYFLAQESGFKGTYEEWLQSVKGAEVELKVESNILMWKYSSEKEWKDLYNLSSIKGEKGSSAYDLYKSLNPDYLGSEEDWINALVLGTLKSTTEETRVSDGDITSGLEYELSSDGTYYILKSIGAEVITKEIVVAETYNGLPVKEVADYAFYYRNDLTQIILPSSITKIGRGAFYGCSSLEKFKMGVCSIGKEAFEGCTKLNNVYFRGNVSEWFNNSFEEAISNPMYHAQHLYLYSLDNELYDLDSQIVVDIPSTVTKIKKYAMAGMESILGCVVPSSVTEIEDAAFYGCSNLETLTLPFTGKNGGEGIDSMLGSIFGEEAYNESISVTQTYPKKYDEDGNVTETDTATYQVPSKLKNVTILTDNIEYGALSGLAQIEAVYVDANNLSERLFYNCASLKKIRLSNNITTLPKHVFEGCTSLKEYQIPASITVIEEGAFKGCSGLEKLTLNFVGKSLGAIGEESVFGYIFGDETYTGGISISQKYSDSKTKSYYIPGALKEVVVNSSVNAYAFYGCASLESVTVNSGNIGNNAFENTSGLKSVYLNNVSLIYQNAFKNSGIKKAYLDYSYDEYSDIEFTSLIKNNTLSMNVEDDAEALKTNYSSYFKIA